MAQKQAKPPTTLSHGELPYPRGALVEDAETGQTGELQGVIEEHVKDTGKLFCRTAYVRPRGGGIEWDAPLARIRPLGEHGAAAPTKRAALIGPADVVGYAGRWRTVKETATARGPMGGLAVLVTWEDGGTARFPAGDELLVREPEQPAMSQDCEHRADL